MAGSPPPPPPPRDSREAFLEAYYRQATAEVEAAFLEETVQAREVALKSDELVVHRTFRVSYGVTCEEAAAALQRLMGGGVVMAGGRSLAAVQCLCGERLPLKGWYCPQCGRQIRALFKLPKEK